VTNSLNTIIAVKTKYFKYKDKKKVLALTSATQILAGDSPIDSNWPNVSGQPFVFCFSSISCTAIRG